STSCYWIGGGGDGTDTGSGGSGSPDGGSGGSSTGGGDDDDNGACRACGDVVVTTPVVEDEIGLGNPLHQKNCEELNRLLEEPSYVIPAPKMSPKAAIIDLQGKLGESNEQGCVLSHNSGLNSFANPVANTQAAQINYPVYAGNYGGMHTHPANSYPPIIPMFSTGDIKALLDFYDNYNNPYNTNPDPSLFVHILVSSDGVYALKIEDISKLQQLAAIYADEDELNDFKRRLERKFNRHFNNMSQQLTGYATDYQKEIGR